ncbi:MAG: hypothetical protein AB7O50_00915 [Pseudolabrys sp.]
MRGHLDLYQSEFFPAQTGTSAGENGTAVNRPHRVVLRLIRIENAPAIRGRVSGGVPGNANEPRAAVNFRLVNIGLPDNACVDKTMA